jgi:SAM-dependent methyltransferase
MWWFAAAHANLLALYRDCASATGTASASAVLDAGCGTGGLLAKLGRQFPHNDVIGLDADAPAAIRAQAKSGRPVCAGSVNALPFADGIFAAIFSADVLCHRYVDEGAALAEFRRCLAPHGVLVLNLPAYHWMLSRHDTAVYNVRRYTRHTIARALYRAGFRLVFASYWNALLFPLMVVSRKLLPVLRERNSDVTLYPAPVEATCRMVTNLERALLRQGVRFPFGGSVLAVAAKAENAHA